MLLTRKNLFISPFTQGKEGFARHPITDDLYAIGKNHEIIKTKKGWILYSGKIFNYNKVMFPSDGDLLVDLFNSMRPEEVAMYSAIFDGFWSICYFEEESGNLYCWTDPLGKKQLYYTSSDKDYRMPEVCTEITPLVRDYANIDEFYRSETFKWGYNFDDRTPWKNVKRIMPNRLYVFDQSGSVWVQDEELVDWYNAEMPNPRDLYGLMMQAVNDRLDNNGEGMGLMLSGGLDSSIIAAILKELGAKVSLFTVNNGDDFPFAHMVADHLGMPIADLSYNMGDEDYVKSCFAYNETPIDLGSVVPNQAMFRNIPTQVLLSGDGADELFGGYHRIDDYDSQLSDVFQELSFYHLPRLDRACARYNKELRNPFLAHDIIRYAIKLPYKERTHKKILKDVFGSLLPLEVIQRGKLPLKNDELRKDPLAYRKRIYSMFYDKNFWHENL